MTNVDIEDILPSLEDVLNVNGRNERELQEEIERLATQMAKCLRPLFFSRFFAEGLSRKGKVTIHIPDDCFQENEYTSEKKVKVLALVVKILEETKGFKAKYDSPDEDSDKWTLTVAKGNYFGYL